jgi:hypothetical protein
MVIGFKKQFVEPILQGTKVHTIRDDKSNRWKPGMIMHMYTGGRFSKAYHQFTEKRCVSTQNIKISVVKASDVLGDDEHGYFICVKVDGIEINTFNLNKLSSSDGFDMLGDFFAWWLPLAMKEPNKTFIGKIIHWTDFKY